ncbi:retrovirus-related Pol polyprotein from transposon 17.6 [Trichonephila clavipes]|nr:retrovirus-related Pol polyprotein from transposon 17.6 [Trichonephila clavipes]
MPRSIESETFAADHVCHSNFQGSALKMEAVGAMRIFQRSIVKRGLKYAHYYGDGDSKGFISVKDTYGKDSVTKYECIGHVQKRVGARLRKLKSKNKNLSGKGKLTDSFIHRLQNYYGIAVRSNVGNLSGLQQNVIAALFHCSSSVEKPMHGQCPIGKDSWCYYQRALSCGKKPNEKYKGLSNEVLNTIKPTYLELCTKELLTKCLHGKTQNSNECLNGVIWQRVPKEVFVCLKTLKSGALDAVIQFNDGYKVFFRREREMKKKKESCKMSQGSSESVQEFAAHINKLGTQIFQSGNSAQNTAVRNANDQLLQSRLISDLRNDIRRFVLARDPINLDESINAALIEEQNVKLNQIANDERSGLSPSQTETSVISALTNKLQEINLRVERLQEASSVTVRKTDFRKLNEITLTQDFVIPTLDDILHEISGSNYFSALDMKSAFNQIPLHFAARHKTAFSTPDGDKYEFNRLCFGLKNSPKAFQSIAQEVLGDLLHNGALVYIDDIILFTKTIDEHFELLVTPEVILIDKDKSVSINEFPVPTNQKQIKSFLGCCNFYRRYIKNFAKRALPLMNLLRKDTPFEWTSETQEAFDDIKKAILNPPVLALPDPDAELQVTTDASSRDIEAVLEQKYTNSEVKPLYFFQRN